MKDRASIQVAEIANHIEHKALLTSILALGMLGLPILKLNQDRNFTESLQRTFLELGFVHCVSLSQLRFRQLGKYLWEIFHSAYVTMKLRLNFAIGGFALEQRDAIFSKENCTPPLIKYFPVFLCLSIPIKSQKCI